MTNTDKFKEVLSGIADNIRSKTGSTAKIPFGRLADEIEKLEALPEMFILEDEEGNQVAAVLTDETIKLTASAENDIRLGTTAITEAGVVTGAKEIPSYFVYQGHRVIPNGSEFKILADGYTKLQAIFCKFNTNLESSVFTDRIAIDNTVYNVNSTDAIATIVTDSESTQISFGITNTSGSIYLIRYFMYKEVY